MKKLISLLSLNQNLLIRRFSELSLIFITIYSLVFIITCKTGSGTSNEKEFISGVQKKTFSEELNLELKIGQTHLDLFQLNQNGFRGIEEINSLLEDLRTNQDNLCEMIHGIAKKKRSIYSLYVNITSKLEENKWLAKIITGCWNYYSMNDIGVERDFLLVRDLYKNEDLDCYSVGFMQPYIMQGILGCRSMNFLDIDWKILESHFWIFRDYQIGFGNEGINWEKYKDTVNWDIGLDMKPRRYIDNLGFETMCGNHQSEICKKAFMRIMERKSNLEEVSFNLGFLHEGHYRFSSGRTIVVYTSNALDPAYTSKKEFKQFLKLLGKAMDQNNKMLMIYHAGGRRAFGLYEILREENFLKIFAICRDDYKYGSIYKNAGESYNIYLDEYTKHQKHIPECRPLVRKVSQMW